jgi:hypothetical protein
VAGKQEKVLFATEGLQRFEKPVPPIFIFGSYLGSLLLTDQRLLFLSAGSSGADRVLAGSLLGILTPESLRTVAINLEKEGSLAVPHSRLVSCSGHRRWDFGRYLRIVYRDEAGSEHPTSFIFRGPVFGSEWIEQWVSHAAPYVGGSPPA